MKNIFFSLIIIFSVLMTQAENVRVLFLGNSYTSVNDLPELISKTANSMGDTVFYKSNIPGGCTFAMHLQNSTSMNLIREGGWDFVVLQAQSQEPSFPYSQFMTATYPYSVSLSDSIMLYNPSARVVFYMTWGRKNGDSYNCQFYPPLCTYEGMDSLLYYRYMMMAEDNDAMVSPVGALWHAIRDNNPEIELYSSDESHPSMAGSYAAACSFYTVLFKKNPINIAFNSTLDPQEALAIRKKTQEVVFDSLPKWFVTTPSSIYVFQSKEVLSFYPNPATDFLNVSFSENANAKYFIHIYSIDGREVFNRTVTETNHSFDIASLPGGIYLLSVYNEKNILIQRNKLIVQKL